MARTSPTDRERLDRVVKAYDIRGLVDDELDVRLVQRLGAAAAAVLVEPGGRFVIGRDMRPSSAAWVDAFVAGVTAAGVDVVDIGLASTDQLYYASGTLEAAGAMVTASHNPPTYNGIKLCRAGAVPVAIDSGLAEIRDRAASGAFEDPTGTGARAHRDLLADFGAHVRSFIDVSLLREVSVAVDAGNGMAGHIWPAVVEGLPIETNPLYFELDGTFPNHPANPLDPANLEDLQAAVVAGGHAIGLAFDGDADRVFAVDEQGSAVASSLIGAVVADRLLLRDPGAIVLHNLICSRTVPETILAAGGQPVRTRVGHSFIKERMAATGAIFAVEHSGHFYFRDNFRADSGIIAALVLLEAIAVADAPLSEVVAPYDRYHGSGELNLEVADPHGAIRAVAGAFVDRAAAHDTEDGLTVDLGDRWFNLRPSNTEPVVRLNVEAADAGGLGELTDEVLASVDAATRTPG